MDSSVQEQNRDLKTGGRRVLIYATTAYMIERFNMMNIRMLQEMGYTVDAACNFEYGNPMSTESLEHFKSELAALNVECIQLPLNRNIFDLARNGRAFIKSLRIMRERRYEFVHCHTPVGAVVARLACRLSGTHVIYTAHGFHFFKGAPRINWLAYYPIEKLLSYITDVLITINKEDHAIAEAKFGMKKLCYVPGIGIDMSKFSDAEPAVRTEGLQNSGQSVQAGMRKEAELAEDISKNKELPGKQGHNAECGDSIRDMNYRDKLRSELGIPDDTMMILSVGELSKRKNYISVLRALAAMQSEFTGAGKCLSSECADVREPVPSGKPFGGDEEGGLKLSSGGEHFRDICYAIAGTGVYAEEFAGFISKHGLSNKVKLLGYREDTAGLYKAADVFLFPSYQEGLSAALMEAMASGLPVAVSRIRGNTDLVDDKGGIMFEVGAEPKSIHDETVSDENIQAAIHKLMSFSVQELRSMGEHNHNIIREGFSTDAVKSKLYDIYSTMGRDK